MRSSPRRRPTVERVVCSSVLRGRASEAGVATVLNARRWKKSRARRRDASARSASLCRFHAHLSRLRLPVPLHRRRRRALVPQPRRAAGRRRPRGHLPDPAPVGARRARRGAGRARGRAPGRAWSSTRPAGAAACCRRSCSAPACSGTCCATARRYDVVHTASFPYFSLLAAALVRAAAPLPAGGRLARGLEPRLLARVPRRRRRAHRRRPCRRSACASRSAPSASRELHARRLRAAPRERRAHRARGRVRRDRSRRASPRAAEPLVVFAGRHIPEKRVPALVPALAAGARAHPRAARRDLGDGPERDEVLGCAREHGPRRRPRGARAS